ncbi:MAG: succinylglutamate-semialdehyde dehydrogenase [Chlamydiales bacterium]
MEKGSHYISGSWIEGNGEELISTNPATNEVIWEGAHATHEEVNEAVEAAHEALPVWSRLPLEKRILFLRQFSRNLKKNQDSLAETISKETGKPLWESKLEVTSMIQKIPISIEAYYERCSEKQIITPTSAIITHHKPHGVIAVFGPFNFPGHLPNGHIVPALLAGNTVVFKSSEKTPLTAQEIIKCWESVSLPPGVLNLVQGGSVTGQALASHPSVAGIFFTGSHRTGNKLAHELSHHPEKILALEMGGNNPLVVTDITDLETAAYLTIQSAYLTSGQRCSCARRLILIKGHEGDEFLKVLSHMISSLKIGKYTDRPEPFMGPVISMESMEQLLNAQATFGARGGKELIEMKAPIKGTSFLTPGLMDVSEVAHRPDEELFGPFLQVIQVNDFDEAIQEANRTSYGLTASLLSHSLQKYQKFFYEVEAGVINWNNGTTGASSRSAFGGIKKSGNHRPSAYYAADYSSYPVASIESQEMHLPDKLSPGVTLLARS